ncbi:MAG: ATP-binding protein [Anaerolineales bacterium]|jgi:MinD superfamily P-loop ATPase
MQTKELGRRKYYHRNLDKFEVGELEHIPTTTRLQMHSVGKRLPMRIGVTGGKGGTGKTTVATSLALALSKTGASISFLDCDVEAPNAHIILKPIFTQRQSVNTFMPGVHIELCANCGRCADACQSNAIVIINGKPFVLPQLCYGCGNCTAICPEKAISEVPKILGVIESGVAKGDITFARGVLNVGEPMTMPVITQLKNGQNLIEADITILDSPPGSSFPVMETLRDTDYIILVTEPTPFGLQDMKLVVQLARELGIPCGIIVNREGIGDQGVNEYSRSADIPILMRIPFDRKISHGIAQGVPLLKIYPEFTQRFQDLYMMAASMIYIEEGVI